MRTASNPIRASILSCVVILAAPEMAMGADLGRYEAPMFVAETTRNWSGRYLGGFAAASFNSGGITVPDYGISISESGTSSFAGLYGGYQRQFGRIVIGTEVDWNAKLSGDNAHLFTVRGRLGYDLGRALLYATAGWGRETFEVPNATPGGEPIDKTLSGLVIGGGIDAWMSHRLSGRLEVLHFMPSEVNMPFGEVFPGGTGPLNLDVDRTLLRAGLTYHFD